MATSEDVHTKVSHIQMPEYKHPILCLSVPTLSHFLYAFLPHICFLIALTLLSETFKSYSFGLHVTSLLSDMVFQVLA